MLSCVHVTRCVVYSYHGYNSFDTCPCDPPVMQEVLIICHYCSASISISTASCPVCSASELWLKCDVVCLMVLALRRLILAFIKFNRVPACCVSCLKMIQLGSSHILWCNMGHVNVTHRAVTVCFLVLSRSRVWAEPCLLSCAVKKLGGSVEHWLEVAEDLFGPYLWGR